MALWAKNPYTATLFAQFASDSTDIYSLASGSPKINRSRDGVWIPTFLKKLSLFGKKCGVA